MSGHDEHTSTVNASTALVAVTTSKSKQKEPSLSSRQAQSRKRSVPNPFATLLAKAPRKGGTSPSQQTSGDGKDEQASMEDLVVLTTQVKSLALEVNKLYIKIYCSTRLI